jgi:hypothetical protein
MLQRLRFPFSSYLRLLRMDTLMRNLKLLALGVLFAMGVALPAHAQIPNLTAEAPRTFLNISFGGQWKEQTFTESSSFTIYNEGGNVASAHSIGGGTLFDVALGARVWKSVSVGLAYSTITNHNDAAVSVRVPHPVVFAQSRTATATATDLEHSENVVHLQFMWTVPVIKNFDVTFMAGPSFFTVRQTVATVHAPQDISDPPPYNNLSISTVSLTDVKDSPVGFNIGVDGTYMIRTIKGVGIGVGGFIRYAGASFDLDVPAGVTLDPDDLKAGGPQGAIGLRLRY